MKKIMFLCTGNTARSQLAEGFARELGKAVVEAHSAGVNPAGHVHPKAIAVMKEAGIDISRQESKGIDHDLLMNMDMVITLCGNAEQTCPMTPPQVKREHWPIEDPVKAAGAEEEVMDEFRKARDEIRARIENLIKELQNGGR
ncbi:MAG: arsenate reductase ArsC [Nitrospiraceae bacterium]|nr:arsenate reductase ArsC [Nitrospiraceae bacterium]MDA8088797.1 arsenate reductase ArsC [Nitrospiraceae bacterium]